MHQFLRYTALLLLIATTGCSSSSKSGSSGWLADDSVLHIATVAQSSDPVVATGNLATLRVRRYSDLRIQNSPRLIGTSNQLIRGMSGSHLIIDVDLADLVTARLKQQFEQAGYVTLGENDAGAARFDVTGVIKDLTLNVKYRDEIDIAIDTTIVDTQTGQAVWSGLVTEKNDRFAGVSGNTKQDVADYLIARLNVVLSKIVQAVNGSLMSSHSELFSQRQGTVPIPGVTNHPTGDATVLPPAGLRADELHKGVGGDIDPKRVTGHGTLHLSSSPSRAKVYIDDVYFGLTPLNLEMSPGVYPVTVKLDGYKSVSEKVSVRDQDTTDMELTLEH